MKVTDINAVKNVTKSLLNIDIDIDEEFSFIVHHPIFNSVVTCVKDDNGEHEIINLTDDESKIKAINFYNKIIAEFDSIYRIFDLINKPYKLTFLKYTKDYLSDYDFANFLREAWVTSENPNDDVNVKIPTLIKWYKSANKKYLMTGDDLEYYNNLSESFTIYRGVGVGRNPKGLSWTVNIDKAEWFANRWGNSGYIETAKINKKDVLAYFNVRGEDEIVADVNKLKIEILN